MAPDKRSMGDRRVQEALDLCLARMRRGESLERCLADFAELADALRPLLLMAHDVDALRDAPTPPPPAGLAAGRERFLAAARATRAAEGGAQSTGHPADAVIPGSDAALDAVVARVALGESLADVLAEYPAALAEAVAPLAETAVALRALGPVPLPPAGLAAGRGRFLAAARRLVQDAGRAAARNGHAADEAAVGAALDAALERAHAGGTAMDAASAGLPAGVAADVRALVATAAAVEAAAVAAPPPPNGLAMGRARFLAAAETLRTAAPAADPAADPVAEALDVVTARVAAGATLDAALANCPTAVRAAVAPLAALACGLAPAAGAAPPPPAGLAAGRERFLAVAEQAEAHHAAIARARRQAALTAAAGEPSSGRQGWFAGGIPALALRVAAAAMLAVVLALGGLTAVGNAPAVASALPGDAAYVIKRLNERIALLTAFDPQARIRLEAEIQARRADEVARLVTLGRAADVSLEGVLVGLVDGGPDGAVLEIGLATADGATDVRRIVLTDATALDLGAFAALGDLPAGSRLALVIRTGGDGAEAIAVRLVAAPPARVVGPAASGARPTVVARVDDPIVAPPTPGGADQPATATPTDPPPPASPSPTAAPATATPTGVPSPAVAPSREIKYKKITGLVVGRPADDRWDVATDGCAARDIVAVDIGALADYVGVDVTGQLVTLRGNYADGAGSPFVAVALLGIHAGDAVATGEELGQVVELTGDGTMLVLTGEGETRAYRIDRAVIEGDLRVGATVAVRYRSCGGETPEATHVVVAGEESVIQRFEGTIAGNVPGVEFTLVVSSPDPGVPDQVRVVITAQTQIMLGTAPALADGQVVEVRGVFDAAGGVVTASSIIVVVDVPPPGEIGAGSVATLEPLVPVEPTTRPPID